MTGNEYQKLSLVPASKTNLEDLLAFLGMAPAEGLALDKYQEADNKAALIMAALGLGGEAGEVLDPIKKAIFHKHKTLDSDKIKDELGDVLWYCSRMASACDLSLDDIMVHNVKKLEQRYSGKFSHDKSINRCK